MNIAEVESTIKQKMVRGLIGGAVGTIVFTIMGMTIAAKLTGSPMDVAAMLSSFLGVPYIIGIILHFGVGTVAFPLGYIVFGISVLPGPPWVRGAIFMFGVYLVAMIVVMPILGQGLFLGSGAKAIAALMGHLVFGVIMGAIMGDAKSE
jgi:hypothetical protein